MKDTIKIEKYFESHIHFPERELKWQVMSWNVVTWLQCVSLSVPEPQRVTKPSTPIHSILKMRWGNIIKYRWRVTSCWPLHIGGNKESTIVIKGSTWTCWARSFSMIDNIFELLSKSNTYNLVALHWFKFGFGYRNAVMHYMWKIFMIKFIFALI